MTGIREGVLPGPMVGKSPLFSLLVLTCLQGEGPLMVSGFGVLVLALMGSILYNQHSFKPRPCQWCNLQNAFT